MKIKILLPALIATVFLWGCELNDKPVDVNVAVDGMDYLPLYAGKDVNIKKTGTIMTIPVIDKLIPIDNPLSIRDKVEVLADSISKNYFHELEIRVLKIDPANNRLVLHLELIEKDNYTGPGSLPPYQSWYDYFQGSAGGSNTTIILKETFLQRYYEGDWIDAILFYYQGEKMGEWDHVFLNGVLNRFE